MNVNLPFGFRDEKIVEISSVENGLACNCFCPCCRKRLVARKGNINEYHFAHFDSEDCNGGIETALHILAIEILEKHKRIVLPSVYLTNSAELLWGPQEITFEKVILERRMSDIIPDIIIFVQNKPLFIEIGITRSDWVKTKRIILSGHSAIELNVRGLFDFAYHKVFGYQDFEKRLIEETGYKRWLNNKKENILKEKLRKLAIGKKIIELDYANFVDNCPIEKRIWKTGFKQGQSCASVNEDCANCQYGEIIDDKVFCSGHQKEEFYNLITTSIKGKKEF